MESVCKAKKAGKPKVFLSLADGNQVHANMFKATMPISLTRGGVPTSLPPPLPTPAHCCSNCYCYRRGYPPPPPQHRM
jgi:hypothetical protein